MTIAAPKRRTAPSAAIRSIPFVLALLFAAAPARAQQIARPASLAPLPAALRTAAHRGLQSVAEVDPEREILVGAGIGCAVVGALFLVFVDAYDGPMANALVGCGFGAFVGGTIAFTSTVRVRPGWDRR